MRQIGVTRLTSSRWQIAPRTRRIALNTFLAQLALATLVFFNLSLAADPAVKPIASNTVPFNIQPGSLRDALRQFGQQASLQLLYDHSVVQDKQAPGLVGEMTPQEALQQLLSGTDLRARFINGSYVAISLQDAVAETQTPLIVGPVASSEADIAVLTDVDVTAQQPWWNSTSGTHAFGFAKPLLETPRSVSYISGDAIDIFSLSVVEDLLRVVPGVFTTTRFGVQGSVDIRNIPADTYFRGMKRLTLQGHGRSVLAAMDSIEVVGGPASPLHGIGKIGGYVNLVPKSGRSRTGQYLDEAHGFVQLIGGEYERQELSFGLGGPVKMASETQGGYYLYGLLEDSDSYAQGVPVKQKLLQAATSVDDMVGPLRLETGFNYQESRTAGALTGRLTQGLVDQGRYIGGSPLVNLDGNGNGTIGYLEMNTASPVVGNLSSTNQPLQQWFAWPVDGAGNPLPLDQFPRVAGIPQTMYDYLQTHPETDPSGVMRAQGVGGPLPVSGTVPAGMVLDPSSVSINTYNPRRSAAFEKDLKAEFFTFFADLVHDSNPDFTVKNQLFFDRMDQYKSSNQPFSQIQDVSVVEDKFTVTKRAENLPSWLRLNNVVSLNLRNTVSKINMTLADYGNHRTDATASSWNEDTAGMTANTTFTSANENTDLASDGLPWVTLSRTEYSEMGLGLLFDMGFFRDTNLLLGVRHDASEASNTNYAGRFQMNTGTSVNPGAYIATADTAENWDSATSWSVSLSRQMSWGLRPYATMSRAGVLLDGNNNSLHNDVIKAGHIGEAELKELGVKADWPSQNLNFSAAFYQQGRLGVSAADADAVIGAYATSTTTRGWQAELKWAPRRNFLLSLYALRQITRYSPSIGDNIQVDARALGFVDVLDAEGNLVYPAEAFLYGGRARILLPDNMPQYERKQGNPEKQLGLTAIYQLDRHWGFTLKSNYLSSTCSGRLCMVKLPQSLVFDTGVFWTSPRFDLKFDVTNITDEHYFRARTGDTLGDVIAQTMPGRRMQVTATLKF
jgi:iron complex outermembrane receptor protein